VEALVVGVVITVALIGTAASIQYATQQRLRASQRNALNAAIDADLVDIKDLATQLTCCTGACTLGIPGASSTCAINNPRDDRYFYPLSDPEASAVDDICSPDGIGILAGLNLVTDFPVNPALAAAGGARVIAPLGNDDGNQNILQVTYTDNNAADPEAPVRVARVVPPMARFCP
jgi:hypothetical protein